ncbi:hypothetical protein BGX28_007362 [Mortierella sp. GBA30]|nr:hypothetical protein BGX28_007362 [Mortierella sp. GBA30]
MPPRQTKTAGVRVARKRKNADRSDNDDSDFDYTHQQRLLQQRATKTNPARSARHHQQQQAVPSLSSSDSPSPTAPMDTNTRYSGDKDTWRTELSAMVSTTGTKRIDTTHRATDRENPTIVVPRSPPTPERTPLRGKVYEGHVPAARVPTTAGESHRQQQQRQHRRQRQHTPEGTTEAIVAIPMRETPMIKKNKDMRSGSRRSSFAMRGKRASSIGNGFSAMPHPSVDPKNFFRHISADESAPIRMKQLMAWCARKCIDTQRSKSQTALRIAKQVEEDALGMLIAGEFSVSWYSRPLDSEPIRTAPKKPHQQNVENQRKLRECEAQIAKLRKEDEEWTRVISSFNTFHASVLDSTPRLPAEDEPMIMPDSFADDVDLELLTADERNLWEKYCKHDASIGSSPVATVPQSIDDVTKKPAKESNRWMVEMMSTLEQEVDRLQDTLYAAASLDKVAKRYTDEVLEQIAAALDDRQRPPPLERLFFPATALPSSSSSSTSVLATSTAAPSTSLSAPVLDDSSDDPREILRALSRLSL